MHSQLFSRRRRIHHFRFLHGAFEFFQYFLTIAHIIGNVHRIQWIVQQRRLNLIEFLWDARFDSSHTVFDLFIFALISLGQLDVICIVHFDAERMRCWRQFQISNHREILPNIISWFRCLVRWSSCIWDGVLVFSLLVAVPTRADGTPTTFKSRYDGVRLLRWNILRRRRWWRWRQYGNVLRMTFATQTEAGFFADWRWYSRVENRFGLATNFKCEFKKSHLLGTHWCRWQNKTAGKHWHNVFPAKTNMRMEFSEFRSSNRPQWLTSFWHWMRSVPRPCVSSIYSNMVSTVHPATRTFRRDFQPIQSHRRFSAVHETFLNIEK